MKLAKHAHWLISIGENAINGYLVYYLNSKAMQLYIPVIAVFAKEQHKGIGSRLMEEALREAIRNKLTSIALEVYETNTQAYRFYIKNHFQIAKNLEGKLLMLRQL